MVTMIVILMVRKTKLVNVTDISKLYHCKPVFRSAQSKGCSLCVVTTVYINETQAYSITSPTGLSGSSAELSRASPLANHVVGKYTGNQEGFGAGKYTSNQQGFGAGRTQTTRRE
jgi:hypothetical protein